MKRVFVFLGIITSALACTSPVPPGALGAFRLADGRLVSVRPSAENTLRYREFRSGRTGRLHHAGGLRFEAGSGFADREPVWLTVDLVLDDDGIARTLMWREAGSPSLEADRIGRERWVDFTSDGTPLVGRLHLPNGPGPHPGIVLVHGSGEDPGSQWLYNGDFLVAHGFAVLAYDKRGTGRSGGDFTFDFNVLARDAAAAADFLRRQAEIDGGRVGLSGYSQGGWVAPLAATLTPASFVLVSYGMIESPAEEARLEMLRLLTDGGVGGNDLLLADSLVSAAVAVVASEFEDGWEHFASLKSRFSDAPWREHLRGTPVDRLMRYPRWLVRLIGRRELPPGLPWYHDSMDVLESLCVPMTWFLGTEDLSAPNELTIARLRAFKEAGKPYDLRIFEGADHTILVFRTLEEGRSYTGYAEGYFEAEVDAALQWANRPTVEPACRP